MFQSIFWTCILGLVLLKIHQQIRKISFELDCIKKTHYLDLNEINKELEIMECDIELLQNDCKDDVKHIEKVEQKISYYHNILDKQIHTLHENVYSIKQDIQG